MKKSTLFIKGMSCNHCVMSVKKELSRVEGVLVNDVSIGAAALEYDESAVQPRHLEEAIRKAGYTLQSIE